MLLNDNHNDNQNDQLFRDRLRDHSSPVRADLWRRIYNGLGSPARRLHLHRHWRYYGAAATTITVALAAHLIFTHPSHTSHPSVPPVNHYSNISHNATRRPDTTTLDQPSPQTPTRHIAPAPENLASTRENPTLPSFPNSNFLDLHRQIQKSKQHNTPLSRETLSATDPATPPAKNPASTTASPNHHPNPVTLPAIARTSTRGSIPARSLMLKSRHNDPNNSNATPDAPRPIKTGYISTYGSVDFPSNHYYTWSYTVGGTVTIQFSRHWSGTAGLEYGRVNVPTQVVPPVGPFDTLHAFYFSNFEVPVLIGYTMMLGSYALTINAGAILNLYQHQSNSPGNLVTSATSTWVFNWPNRDSYGAYVGADIYRPLGHSFRVFAQPYARYSISNYRMFIPVQRFSYGALLGVRYQL